MNVLSYLDKIVLGNKNISRIYDIIKKQLSLFIDDEKTDDDALLVLWNLSEKIKGQGLDEIRSLCLFVLLILNDPKGECFIKEHQIEHLPKELLI